ncbi:DUF1329 domain-containing protein [Actimicrobium antarcticum]|uniref:Outer membrane lipoprotein-sorting protein n=1 Tax=Actimicrobium antarcticum TaxID=1051899 RepID=A0ABP7SXV5_9BURK
MHTLNKLAAVVAGCFFASVAGLSAAAELPEGTVISAANLDKIINDTFQGQPVGKLLTESMEMRVRKQGWKLPLVKASDVVMDDKFNEASKRNIGKVQFNSATRQVEGWEGGMPFPDVKESDPLAAEKLIWNWYYGQPRGDIMNVPNVQYVLINGDKGVEQEQTWGFIRYSMKGKLGANKAVEGDGKELSRTIFVAQKPADLKGLGTFTIRHDSAQVEDVWAYIPAVRRIRRLSGGAWMDPIGGTDQLQDDIEIFNAQPSWYKGYKLLGKRWILAAVHAQKPSWKIDGKTVADRYPVLDLSGPPYWNLSNDRYEPREVYVIEATTPTEHPYSKKVVYMDVKYPRLHYGEAFDRKGDLWKIFQFNSYPGRGVDGFHDIRTTSGVTIDLKRNHATAFFTDTSTWSTNAPGITSKNVTLQELQAAGR